MAAELSSVAQMTFSGLYGGREAVAFSLTKLVKERISNSVLYLILETRSDETAMRELLAKLDEYAIPHRIFRIQSRFSRKLVHELAEALRADGIQVVHCHCYKSVFFALLARSRGRLQLKIAFTLHGLVAKFSLNTMVLHLVNMLSIATADSIIGCCAERVRFLRKLPVLGKRTFVIQNGLLKTSHAVAGQKAVKAAGSGMDRAVVRIGLVGRLSPEKNIPLLLNSIARIKRNNSASAGLHCTIAGDGELKGDLVQMAADLQLGDIVDFPGFVPDTDKLYASLDILVLTSDYEGTPMCLLEGMAHGLPIIASAVGGITDILDHGQNALLFHKGDIDTFTSHLLELICNGGKRELLGNAAHETLNTRFSAKVWCDRHMEHYRYLLGEKQNEF